MYHTSSLSKIQAPKIIPKDLEIKKVVPRIKSLYSIFQKV